MAGKNSPYVSSNNSIETDHRSEGFPRAAVDTIKKDLGQESMRELWKQFFGTLDPSEKVQTAGEMTAGSDIVFTTNSVQPKKQEVLSRPDILPGINYRSDIIHGGERAAMQENREIQYRLQEVQVEIQRLITSYQALEIEFRDVAMPQASRNIGVYHINFLDFVLAAIRSARIKIEDSGAWLGTMKGKHDQRGMAKVPYAQSNEKSLATQAG